MSKECFFSLLLWYTIAKEERDAMRVDERTGDEEWEGRMDEREGERERDCKEATCVEKK